MTSSQRGGEAKKQPYSSKEIFIWFYEGQLLKIRLYLKFLLTLVFLSFHASSHSLILCSIFGTFSKWAFTPAPTQQYASTKNSFTAFRTALSRCWKSTGNSGNVTLGETILAPKFSRHNVRAEIYINLCTQHL